MNLDFFEKNKYAVVDSFFSEPDLFKLQSFLKNKYQNQDFKKASIGRDQKISATQRGDFIYWLDSNDSSHIPFIFDFFKNFQQTLNQEFFLSLKNSEAHITVYPPGTHYEKHIDQLKKASLLEQQRKISLILYLNSNWKPSQGGELVLYNPQNTEQELTRIEPLGGRLVYFLSDLFPHEVLPTRDQERISLTAWFLS